MLLPVPETPQRHQEPKGDAGPVGPLAKLGG